MRVACAALCLTAGARAESSVGDPDPAPQVEATPDPTPPAEPVEDSPPRGEATDAPPQAEAPTDARPQAELPSELNSAESSAAPEVELKLGATRPVESIGSLSVGHPHAGFLFNGVQLPKSKYWTIADPGNCWGTEETLRDLHASFAVVHEQFPHSPPVVIGSISPKNGGPFPPHKSHRSGRDVDVYFYYKPNTTKYYEPAGEHNLDKARTWALLRAVLTKTDVDFVLIDQKVQRLLEQYALSIGENPAWIEDIFNGNGRPLLAAVKHVPGHTSHMHIRFTSPNARKRGVLAYDALVEQGHIEPPTRQVEHTVVAGDTLSELGQRYRLSIDAIVRLNELESTVIKVGQKLVMQAHEDIRGARDPVVVPRRRLPRSGPSGAELETKAALLEIERQLREELSL